MKKIIHILFSLKSGGTENMLVDIANEQAKSHDVTLIIIHNVIDIEVLSALSTKVNLVRLDQKPPTRVPWFVFRLWRIIHKKQPEIVHLHNASTLKLFPFLIRKILPKTSCRFTIHTTGFPYGREIHNADRLYAISQAVRDDVLIRVEHKDIEVVANGINCDLFLQRNDFTLHKTFKIIQVGRLVHKIKGQDILLHALPVIIETLKDITVEVHFVGDGPSMSLLKDMAVALGLKNNVSFVGAKRKEWLYQNIKSYDLLLQPSRIEGFGLTILEGMAANIPVLVANIAGPMEVIMSGAHGYFFETENNNDCATKIMEVISDYQRGVIGNRVDKTYTYVKENFDIKKTAERYAEV